MCPYFHVSNLHRRKRHLLDQSISPEPSSLGPRYFVEDAIALRHRMFWTKGSDCFAIEELDKATWLVIARRVKEDAGCPIEFDGEASPPVEKQTRRLAADLAPSNAAGFEATIRSEEGGLG